MYKRITVLAALAAVLAVGVAGTASARPIVSANVGPAGLGYNSDGTFDGLADVIDQVCAEAGQQDVVPETEGVSASLCVPRPVGEDEEPGANGYELAQAGSPAVGFGSDGFFDSLKNLCEVGSLVGQPIDGQTVELAPGVTVSICAD